MRLTQTIRPNPTRAAGRRHGQYGLSLVEMIVALAVGSIVLVITGLLSMYGSP
jgi:prepilin-type N-terminal cleavage/methylation domain-containing protein